MGTWASRVCWYLRDAAGFQRMPAEATNHKYMVSGHRWVLQYGLLDPKIPYYSLRVQIPNNDILAQNLYYNYYYPNPKYLIIGYMDP